MTDTFLQVHTMRCHIFKCIMSTIHVFLDYVHLQMTCSLPPNPCECVCVLSADGVMRTMSPDKLLKGMPTLQGQIDALLEFEVSLLTVIITGCILRWPSSAQHNEI